MPYISFQHQYFDIQIKLNIEVFFLACILFFQYAIRLQYMELLVQRLLQQAPVNPTPRPPGSRPAFNVGHTHYYMMVIVWLAAGTIGLWSMLFKQYRCAQYLHFISMSILIIITWMSGFLAIIYYGLNAKIGSVHIGLGLAILISVILQGILGIIAWSCQRCAKVKPACVYYFNLVHRLLGYAIYIIVLVQFMIFLSQDQDEHQLFLATLIISVVSYAGFIIFKFFKKSMQSYTALSTKGDKNIPLVRNSKDLAKIHEGYFIFADKVYDINNVITNHPGGFDVINRIRGRQVDRFIYGSEALDSVGSMKVHSHSASSISMAGKPIGILHTVSPFQNMKQKNSASVYKVTQPCKSKYIYAPYLISKGEPFIFQGYTDISQLGRYYAVTINKKKTRLYSVVNFMHDSNLQLMGLIIGKNFEIPQKQATTFFSGDQFQTARGVINYDYGKDINTIPLLIKKYDGGVFTSQFLSRHYTKNVQISKPRGRGLNLGQVNSGNILILAGGTGINPFCDLIDLLYKQYLISINNNHSNQIMAHSPIVKQRLLLNNYKFTFYLSVHEIGEMHQITLHQLNFLGKNGVIFTNIRVNQQAQILDQIYTGIGRIGKRFEHYFRQLFADTNNFTHIYMCGPPVMTSELIKSMNSFNVPKSKYTVL